MTNESRPLILEAGGVQIADGARIRVRGSAAMNLMPNCYFVDVYGLTGYDMAEMTRKVQISVYGEYNGLLLTGELEDIYAHSEALARITTLVVSDGMSFWQTPVSRTLKAGATVSQTARALLKDVVPMGYNAKDFKILRGQTYTGRLADQIAMLAKSVDARVYFLNGSVQFTGKNRTTDITELPEDEIVNRPGEADGVLSVETIAKGYSVGRGYSVYGRPYRLIRQTYDLDNWQGAWKSELFFLDESVITEAEMGGG